MEGDITTEIVALLRKMGGAAAVPIGVIFIFVLLKSVLDFAGNPGKKIAGWKGEGVRKRFQDTSDAIDQNREAAAVKGGGISRFLRPGARGRQRRALRGQDAQSNLEAANASFGQTDKAASAYTQSISQNKAISAAAAAANNTALVTSLANNPNLLNDKLSKDAQKEGSGMQEALAVQQERAIAEAIKDVELKATFDPGDVKAIGDAMVKATKEGDSIGARAYQNMLMKAGGPGTDQYRKSMGEIKAEDMAPGTGSAEAVTAMKRNMLVNHGNIKETAADLIKHASSKEGTTMESVSGSGGTWSMSSEDLVKQKTHSLQQAVASGGVSFDQAKEIQSDTQLYRKLDKGGKALIDGVVSGTVNIAHEEALVQNALHDMDKRP